MRLLLLRMVVFALVAAAEAAIAAAQSQIAADTKAGNREARRIGLTSCAG